mgnify:CR=1 FL=1
MVDERAFVDGGTASVRCSDFAMQLYCLVGEGWQDLAVGQIVSAQFRAQQVKKLASPIKALFSLGGASWSAPHICSIPRMSCLTRRLTSSMRGRASARRGCLDRRNAALGDFSTSRAIGMVLPASSASA